MSGLMDSISPILNVHIQIGKLGCQPLGGSVANFTNDFYPS